MTTYLINPNSDGTGFNVSIASANGARQTMLGFTTETEANAWIDQDRRLNVRPAPSHSSDAAAAYG